MFGTNEVLRHLQCFINEADSLEVLNLNREDGYKNRQCFALSQAAENVQKLAVFAA
jgi:hypothetical protein